MQNTLIPKSSFYNTSLVRIITTTTQFINKYIKIHWLFIILFAHTGFSKLFDIDTFQFAMWKAELLRPYYIPLSYTIPITEIVISILLAFSYIKIGKLKFPSRKIGLFASLLLMLSFTGYLGYSLLFHAGHLPCTCGGIISGMTWKQHLVFNVVFSLLAFRAILLNRK